MSSEIILPEELSFGAALAELEQIVRALEGGQLELEEGLERYERGVSLLRACQDKLAQAKQRVTMLVGELESDEGEVGDSVEEES
ncbi:MAG: exodeoxyribonuclease VII small subunit [Coriobacteriia bacterium]|nr:exodeoxyribonuclease VII small subunit [Coriobacteriia bacterium]